jgi:hypothetical protein
MYLCRHLLLATLIPIAAGCNETRSQTEFHCQSTPSPYECLVENLSTSYLSDYRAVFDIFDEQARKALACESTADATLFLRIHGADGVDGEVAEAVAGVTEKLALEKPACLLEASVRLSDQELENLARRLRSPLFHDDHRIRASLDSVEGVTPTHPLVAKLREE